MQDACPRPAVLPASAAQVGCRRPLAVAFRFSFVPDVSAVAGFYVAAFVVVVLAVAAVALVGRLLQL